MSSLTFSPAAAALEDDDLLSEILLRLSPQPSSLPRASLVCKQWRSLVADPGFIRRFRLRHRRNPPLLGCFVDKYSGLSFVPTMEAPNRVPAARFFSSQLEKHSMVLGCRHGLLLLVDESREQVMVRDPVTADQHRITVPAGFGKTVFHGAVLRAAGDVQHFEVVLAKVDTNKEQQHRQALACVYSSKTGIWGDHVSAPLPPKSPTSSLGGTLVSLVKPAVLAENSLYWILDLVGILEFDLVRKNIAVIEAPADVLTEGKHRYTLTRAESGGLGFLSVRKSDCIAQLWKRLTDCGGVSSSWVLDRTIELDKLLPLNSHEERVSVWILGFAEDNNVVFLWTFKGIFMIHLKLSRFEQLPRGDLNYFCHPFESVYAAGTKILVLTGGIGCCFDLSPIIGATPKFWSG